MPIAIDDKLGTFFTFGELTFTNHRAYLDANRVVTDPLVSAARDLCSELLDPIRTHYGAPLIIHSGYRCPQLNAALGGSSTSQHMAFEAADFHVNDEDLSEVWKWIWKGSGLKFGQLILEGWSQNKPGWIHVSLGPGYRSPHRCNEVMTWDAANDYVRVN